MEEVSSKNQNPFAETVQIVADAAEANGNIWLKSIESVSDSEQKAAGGGLLYEAKITVSVRIQEPS